MTLAPLMSSTRQDWQTPDHILRIVRSVGLIAYDPCTTAQNPTEAAQFTYPPNGDGLATAEAAQGAEIILLANARTDTRWFDLALDHCDAWCAWRGRIRFRGATAGAPFPSAFFYWGRNYSAFQAAFKAHGRVFRAWSKA